MYMLYMYMVVLLMDSDGQQDAADISHLTEGPQNLLPWLLENLTVLGLW